MKNKSLLFTLALVLLLASAALAGVPMVKLSSARALTPGNQVVFDVETEGYKGEKSAGVLTISVEQPSADGLGLRYEYASDRENARLRMIVDREGKILKIARPVVERVGKPDGASSLTVGTAAPAGGKLGGAPAGSAGEKTMAARPVTDTPDAEMIDVRKDERVMAKAGAPEPSVIFDRARPEGKVEDLGMEKLQTAEGAIPCRHLREEKVDITHSESGNLVMITTSTRNTHRWIRADGAEDQLLKQETLTVVSSRIVHKLDEQGAPPQMQEEKKETVRMTLRTPKSR
ncbi:MAG: hypothetical protein KA419_08080 [Acidobacteria bacterium]|nr:hypothetical protein [Acidobacteriota bacterium]